MVHHKPIPPPSCHQPFHVDDLYADFKIHYSVNEGGHHTLNALQVGSVCSVKGKGKTRQGVVTPSFMKPAEEKKCSYDKAYEI